MKADRARRSKTACTHEFAHHAESSEILLVSVQFSVVFDPAKQATSRYCATPAAEAVDRRCRLETQPRLAERSRTQACKISELLARL